MYQTKTGQLHDKLEVIAKRHAAEIDRLSYRGPRCGRNARNIDGWSRSTGNITRAGGLPMMKWWDGANPTPSTGIPMCCADEAVVAEKEVFGKEDEENTSLAAATLGRKGGSVKSEKKTIASRENGKKGGRPRKVAK